MSELDGAALSDPQLDPDLKFSPEQKALIGRLVKQRKEKIRDGVARQFAFQIQDLQTSLEDLHNDNQQLETAIAVLERSNRGQAVSSDLDWDSIVQRRVAREKGKLSRQLGELQAGKAEAERQLDSMRRQTVRSEIVAAAFALGAIAPEDVGDALEVKISLDDEPGAIKQAVSDFLKTRPHLIKSDRSPKAPAKKPGAQGQIWTRARIAELAKDPREYEKHRPEIQKAQQEGKIL